MNEKTNGSQRPDGKNNDEKGGENERIIHFPTLAERDRNRREQLKREQQEQSWRAQYRRKRRADTPPFFNLSKIPLFTRMLVAAFIAVHLVVFFLLDVAERLEIFYFLGFVPGYFTGALDGVPWFAFLGPFTHMFIHGGWMHLAFNGVMGLALGTLFERIYGPRMTAFVFFACGLAGAGLYFALNPFSNVPVIGASGGISGLFGTAIVLLYSQGQMGPLTRRGPWPLILFWVGFMIIAGILSSENMAWQAHLGGFLAGIGLLQLIRTGRLRF